MLGTLGTCGEALAAKKVWLRLNDRTSAAADEALHGATTLDRRRRHALVGLRRSLALVNEVATAAVGCKLPDLNANRHEVAEPPDIMLSKRLQTSSVFEGDQNLPILRRGEHEIEHRLVPHGQLGAGCIAAPRPCMAFALNKHGRCVGSQIEYAGSLR